MVATCILGSGYLTVRPLYLIASIIKLTIRNSTQINSAQVMLSPSEKKARENIMARPMRQSVPNINKALFTLPIKLLGTWWNRYVMRKTLAPALVTPSIKENAKYMATLVEIAHMVRVANVMPISTKIAFTTFTFLNTLLTHTPASRAPVA